MSDESASTISPSPLPPTYSRFSLPATYESGPVPTYTELAHTSERVLHSAPASPVTSRDSGTPCHPAYKYRTDHLEINLGRCPWGLLYAAYGKGGIIDGTVKFTKKCSHVVKVTVTVISTVFVSSRTQFVDEFILSSCCSETS